MKGMRTIFLFALLVTLGAGCLSKAPEAAPQDSTPGVNEVNCVKSGGAVVGDSCECAENYAPDPAGFCTDAEGRPGGEMAPK